MRTDKRSVAAPLRNAALQPAFFHNGAMTRIQDAIRHHLDDLDSARNYNPHRAAVVIDLRYRIGPIEPVLARVDEFLQTPITLTGGEFEALAAFVRDALLDERATRRHLSPLVPATVPSGYPPMDFEEWRQAAGCPWHACFLTFARVCAACPSAGPLRRSKASFRCTPDALQRGKSGSTGEPHGWTESAAECTDEHFMDAT
jgi:hypothetical protein